MTSKSARGETDSSKTQVMTCPYCVGILKHSPPTIYHGLGLAWGSQPGSYRSLKCDVEKKNDTKVRPSAQWRWSWPWGRLQSKWNQNLISRLYHVPGTTFPLQLYHIIPLPFLIKIGISTGLYR